MAKTIYTGPDNKRLGLRKFQIFDGVLPQHIAEAVASNPAIGNSLIDFDRFKMQKAPGSPTAAAVKPVAIKLGPPIRSYKQFTK